MPFKGLAFFADVKRKVVKTQKFLHKSVPIFVKYSFHFTYKNESFLNKHSSDVRNYHSFSAIECQLTAFAWLLCFFSEIMLIRFC